MYSTQWTHSPVTLTSAQQQHLDFEIADISEQLDSASDLIFHTVKITDDWNGPIVIIDGREGLDDVLFLTYYENPEWTSL